MTFRNLLIPPHPRALNPVIICLVLALLLNHFRVVENYRVYNEPPSSSQEDTDNLAYQNFVNSDYSFDHFNRKYRSTNVKSITDGHVYSFQNVANNLYLTSTFSKNPNMPSRVALTAWGNQAQQLWETSTLKPNKGFSLKPLENEFNSITSQIVKKAHSYHPWEFVKKGEKWILKTFSNGKHFCLGTSKKMPIGIITELMKCNPGENKQLWRIVDRF